jgi:hypothetical protein
MSYIYEVDVKSIYQARFDQFLAFGIPRTDVVALPTFRKPAKFDRRETEIFRERTNKADFVAASRVASVSSMGLFAPIGEVDMKSAPGPVRASRTDMRSDRSRP